MGLMDTKNTTGLEYTQVFDEEQQKLVTVYLHIPHTCCVCGERSIYGRNTWLCSQHWQESLLWKTNL